MTPRAIAAAVLLIACLLLPSQHLRAQQSQSALDVKLQQASAAAFARYNQKDFAGAAQILAAFFALPGSREVQGWQGAMYNLACFQVMAGNKAAGIESLELVASNENVVSPQDLLKDSDLVSLHDDPTFLHIAEEMRMRQKLWNTEPGENHPFAPDLSVDDKVAGLSILWSEARYNFAFFARQPDLDWNQTYLDFLPRVRETKSTAEYYRLLMRFAAALKDGHTNVYPPDELMDSFYASPGIRTELIENHVVVTEVNDSKLGDSGWKVGDVITRVNGEDVHAFAEREVAPYASSSTPQDLAARTFTYGLLNGDVRQPLTLAVVNAQGIANDRTVNRLSVKQRQALPKNSDESFKLLRNGYAYLEVNEFEDNQGVKNLLSHFDEIRSSKGLIVDVRRNGGGSTEFGFQMLRILARRPFQGSLQRTPLYRAVDRARGGTSRWSSIPPPTVQPDPEHHLDVPVAVLTSARTFSAAEDFVVAFDAMHRGILVGEPTGGSTGQPFLFSLPGGGHARICTKDDRYPDGKIFEGVGIVPQIHVSPTLKGFQTGADPVLDAAINALAQARSASIRSSS